MTRRNAIHCLLSLVPAALFAGCSPQPQPERTDTPTAQPGGGAGTGTTQPPPAGGSDASLIRATGTVTFIALEGGFYGILADNGQRYDPINLAKEFQQDGLRVRFEARPRPDMASFHMWGTLVEIVSISRA